MMAPGVGFEPTRALRPMGSPGPPLTRLGNPGSRSLAGVKEIDKAFAVWARRAGWPHHGLQEGMRPADICMPTPISASTSQLKRVPGSLGFNSLIQVLRPCSCCPQAELAFTA